MTLAKSRHFKRDVKAISKTLVETSSDAIVDLSRLSRLQRELRFLNALEKILSTTLNLEVTRLSDKVQKEHSEQYKNKEIDFLNHFLLKSVKEQLDLYNVSNIPDKQALADGQQDIPQVFRSFEKNNKQARQLLTWI
ncbi:hypothetical protein C2G38_2181916 [Gigaspora rosea]|uniref:Uncharacterized protein n=1 Tax=Gigaspora rosea TaxID=44941 RepID=A0A397VJS5_9GLOM|nr:hypothetical protein C2G38_2181916 [Gigaspora rosea]